MSYAHASRKKLRRATKSTTLSNENYALRFMLQKAMEVHRDMASVLVTMSNGENWALNSNGDIAWIGEGKSPADLAKECLEQVRETLQPTSASEVPVSQQPEQPQQPSQCETSEH